MLYLDIITSQWQIYAWTGTIYTFANWHLFVADFSKILEKCNNFNEKISVL